MNASQTILLQADIIHDRFHTAGYLNAAVDKTRRAEHKTLLQQDCCTLKNSKYLWLKGPDHLTDTQRERFADLRDQDLATAKVWSFKETFRSFFACKTVGEGHLFFIRWYEDAVALGNTHLTKVANMLNRHLTGLLAYLRHRRTNAMAESLNSRIQHIKACALGSDDSSVIASRYCSFLENWRSIHTKAHSTSKKEITHSRRSKLSLHILTQTHLI